MKRIIILSLLLASGAGANGQSFWGCGATAAAEAQPKPAGWCAYAIEAAKSQQIYSISELDFLPAGRTLTTSVQTGVATPIRTFGPVALYGMATAGAATGATTSGAFSGGGLLTIPLKKPGWLLVIAARLMKTAAGGNETLIQVGIGKGATP